MHCVIGGSSNVEGPVFHGFAVTRARRQLSPIRYDSLQEGMAVLNNAQFGGITEEAKKQLGNEITNHFGLPGLAAQLRAILKS